LTKKIIYPGTFDPITLGHIDLIQRAIKIFDKIIVAIAKQPKKNPIFTYQERTEFAKKALLPNDKIEICSFSGLLVEFAREKQASSILRVLRAVSDFEFEFQLASMNRHLAPDIETIFLAPSDQYVYLSSSLVREAAEHGADVSEFVSPYVADALKKHFN
jgi:pantetheine-phosphate adenylyltransferase